MKHLIYIIMLVMIMTLTACDDTANNNTNDNNLPDEDSECPGGPVMSDCGAGIYGSYCADEKTFVYCDFVSEPCLQGSIDVYVKCEDYCNDSAGCITAEEKAMEYLLGDWDIAETNLYLRIGYTYLTLDQQKNENTSEIFRAEIDYLPENNIKIIITSPDEREGEIIEGTVSQISENEVKLLIDFNSKEIEDSESGYILKKQNSNIENNDDDIQNDEDTDNDASDVDENSDNDNDIIQNDDDNQTQEQPTVLT